MMSLRVWLVGEGGGVSVQGGHCPEGSPSGRPPCTVKSGRYAPYWNLFLCKLFLRLRNNINLKFFGFLADFQLLYLRSP